MAGKYWIKIWKKAINDPIFKGNIQKFGFWTWCICKAMDEDGCYPLGAETVNLKKGQFIYGRKAAHRDTGISESTLYRWLNQFEELGMIKKHPVNHQYTIVTISKYKAYQDDKTKAVEHDKKHTSVHDEVHGSVHTSDTVYRRKEDRETSSSEIPTEEDIYGYDPLVLLQRLKEGKSLDGD